MGGKNKKKNTRENTGHKEEETRDKDTL